EIAPEPLPLIHPPHELLVSAYELFFSLFSHFQRVIACFLAQIICVTAQRLNGRQTAPTYQTMPYKQYGQTRA
ncbi:uncharacterized protein ASPGLDRAFT_48710, partial [Aspergillus glaucus CBS 516.65]